MLIENKNFIKICCRLILNENINSEWLREHDRWGSIVPTISGSGVQGSFFG
jgi:hypothetical protein